MEQLLIDLVAKYPVAASIVGVVGTFRFVFKPLMSAVKQIVSDTPSKKDDEFLGKVESNKIYKAFVYVIDWLTSIKLPVK
jgi:hypothetical protein